MKFEVESENKRHKAVRDENGNTVIYKRCSKHDSCVNEDNIGGGYVPMDLDHFAVNSGEYDGFQNYCKPCKSIKDKKRNHSGKKKLKKSKSNIQPFIDSVSKLDSDKKMEVLHAILDTLRKQGDDNES